MGHFLPFYSPKSLKNKNFKKMKKQPGDIIILHKCTKNYDQMMYGSWDMVRDRLIISHLGLCFALLPFYLLPFCPNSPKNQNFAKMNKEPGDIILHKCTKNYDQMMYGSWDMLRDRLRDGQTDGRTEKVTYRGGCPT